MQERCRSQPGLQLPAGDDSEADWDDGECPVKTVAGDATIFSNEAWGTVEEIGEAGLDSHTASDFHVIAKKAATKQWHDTWKKVKESEAEPASGSTDPPATSGSRVAEGRGRGSANIPLGSAGPIATV